MKETAHYHPSPRYFQSISRGGYSDGGGVINLSFTTTEINFRSHIHNGADVNAGPINYAGTDAYYALYSDWINH